MMKIGIFKDFKNQLRAPQTKVHEFCAMTYCTVCNLGDSLGAHIFKDHNKSFPHPSTLEPLQLDWMYSAPSICYEEE